MSLWLSWAARAGARMAAATLIFLLEVFMSNLHRHYTYDNSFYFRRTADYTRAINLYTPYTRGGFRL